MDDYSRPEHLTIYSWQLPGEPVTDDERRLVEELMDEHPDEGAIEIWERASHLSLGQVHEVFLTQPVSAVELAAVESAVGRSHYPDPEGAWKRLSGFGMTLGQVYAAFRQLRINE